MTEPKKGLFQIRLLTAIAVMFVAGGFICVNIAPWKNSALGQLVIGWPHTVYERGDPKPFTDYPMAFFDGFVLVLAIILTVFAFEAPARGWSAGKTFVWAFIGVALSLQMLYHLHALIDFATK